MVAGAKAFDLAVQHLNDAGGQRDRALLCRVEATRAPAIGPRGLAGLEDGLEHRRQTHGACAG